MILYDHQNKFLSKNDDKKLLCWGTGTGKTLTAILWSIRKAEKDILVVAPKTLLTNWKRNYQKHYALENAVITENKLRNKIVIENNERRILLVSKEQFKKEKFDNVDTVIIDEAHYFSGVKSAMFKTMNKFLHDKPHVLLLTATPYLSSPFNILALGNLLGRREYEWSWIYFKQKYFYDVKLQPKNPRSRVISVVKNNLEGEMARRVREIANVVRMDECVDVPESIFSVEYFSESKDQIEEIKNLFEPHYISYWTKKHQIYGGGLKGDEYSPPRYFGSDKFERALELIEKHKKIIIVCRYTHEIDRFAEELKDKGIRHSIINGQVKDKQAVLDIANSESEHVLLVNAKICEGWEAKSFDTIVFYSYDFSLVSYVQMCGRIQRIDSVQKCKYISLVVEDSIDEDVYKSVVIKKQDFHLEIYEKEKTGEHNS